MTASLKGKCQIQPPGIAWNKPIKELLDPPNAELDQADASRIAGSIIALNEHNARHQALGHGFYYNVLDGSETTIPTITRSYYKINTGPFVKTQYGLRLLRKAEIERIQGCTINTPNYATAVQILGQGVQTRLWRKIADQLSTHLQTPQITKPVILNDFFPDF
jgi:hypothetical protein